MSHKMLNLFSVVVIVLSVLLAAAQPAFASPAYDKGGNPPTKDNGPTVNSPDTADKGPGQGKSPSVPDQNGKGPERDEDPDHHDGNNGQGNDPDCLDDSEGKGLPGHCKPKATKTPEPKITKTPTPTITPTPVVTVTHPRDVYTVTVEAPKTFTVTIDRPRDIYTMPTVTKTPTPTAVFTTEEEIVTVLNCATNTCDCVALQAQIDALKDQLSDQDAKMAALEARLAALESKSTPVAESNAPVAQTKVEYSFGKLFIMFFGMLLIGYLIGKLMGAKKDHTFQSSVMVPEMTIVYANPDQVGVCAECGTPIYKGDIAANLDGNLYCVAHGVDELRDMCADQ